MSTDQRFHHEAFFYAGEDDFLAGTAAFIREGVERGEPTLVVVNRRKIDALRAELGEVAEGVRFEDMVAVGRNPARIIPVWHRFLTDNGRGGRSVRGIGEPVWDGRNPTELVECRHHEALLNIAFADVPRFRMLCPYDTATLDPAVIADAYLTHPLLGCNGHPRPSSGYNEMDMARLFSEPLPPAPAQCSQLTFHAVRSVRRFVAEHLAATAIAREDIDDVILAVNEVAANSLVHGGGWGTLRMWWEGNTLVCQVDDDGQITDPLVGQRAPTQTQHNGRGLWLVHQLCDLAQVRTSATGTTTRLYFRSLDRK